MVTFWVFEICYNLSFLVLSQFDYLSFVTIWVFGFLSQFDFFSFVTICFFFSFVIIWILIFVTIWFLALSQFKFLSFVNIWVLLFMSQIVTNWLFEFCPNLTFSQGAREVNQQLIGSGSEQCSRHLKLKIGLPISFFWSIDQIPKQKLPIHFWIWSS